MAALIGLVLALTLVLEHVRQPQGLSRLFGGGIAGLWGILGAYLGCAAAFGGHPADPQLLQLLIFVFGPCLFIAAMVALVWASIVNP